MKVVIVGGGAAGFFAAIQAKASNPYAQVILLEKANALLSKVRISGGGRCNVTHACFDPKELAKRYPRGSKELIGPFYRFQPRDTLLWFESRGVRLKTEEDGRIFPVSDSSEEVIQCLLREASRLGVEIRTQCRIDSLQELEADRLLLATGSNKKGYEWARAFGHTIQSPVPSLFTFNIPDFPLVDLSGTVAPQVTLSMGKRKYVQEGPLLITHWGFSGPAALKLSAWAARFLHEREYRVELHVSWAGDRSQKEVLEALRETKIVNRPRFGLPKKLWSRLVERAQIFRDVQISEKALNRLTELLTCDRYQVEGKTTHKAEFVTCGGVTLSEVNFKTMESRCTPGLYFAGEILDIDGITGGFNFQNAWTTGYLAGSAISMI